MEQAPRNLTYTGEVRDLPVFLERKRVQISLIPSRWEEPFGLAAIESMAASCLTVVSDRGMLPIIAERTGAFYFRDTIELESILERIEAMSAAERAERVRRQQGEVIRQFGAALFRRHFVELFERRGGDGCDAPARVPLAERVS
jgi:glycosyltransferase involved in cell wall biosynthesis